MTLLAVQLPWEGPIDSPLRPWVCIHPIYGPILNIGIVSHWASTTRTLHIRGFAIACKGNMAIYSPVMLIQEFLTDQQDIDFIRTISFPLIWEQLLKASASG